MLAEFNPFQWDWVVFGIGAISLVALYFWRKKKIIEEIQSMTDRYKSKIPNVELVFWHDDHLMPTNSELELVEKVFCAAKVAWPEKIKRLTEARYNIWVIRSPEQRIRWRQYNGIKWKDVPSKSNISEKADGQGYGGLSEHSTNIGAAYFSTFFPGRTPERLLAHELTHCVTRINNDAAGNHPVEFLEFERRLRNELEYYLKI